MAGMERERQDSWNLVSSKDLDGRDGNSICSSWRCPKPQLEDGQVGEVANTCVTPNGFAIMINREAQEGVRAGAEERQCRKGLHDSAAEITKRGALDEHQQVNSHFSTLEVWTRAANWMEVWGPEKKLGQGHTIPKGAKVIRGECGRLKTKARGKQGIKECLKEERETDDDSKRE